MREILFRGKRKDNGEWVEGFYYVRQAMHGKLLLGEPEHVITTGVLKIYGAYGEREQLSQVEVIPETVGQFTGMTAESGVKIFEGDILEHPNKAVSVDRYVVKWDDVLGAWNAKWTEGAGGVYIGVASLLMELVGNIHDNPELLEVK